MTLPRHPLLDLAPPTPEEFFSAEVDAGRVLRSDDVVITQAEAALALEAVLLGVVRPGTRTLCLSSGTYGVWFANELRKLGAGLTVIEVDSRARRSTRPRSRRRSSRILRSSSSPSCTASR